MERQGKVIIIAHSFGALIAQFLRAKGIGIGYVLLDSAPAKGTQSWLPGDLLNVLRSTWRMILPFQKTRHISLSEFAHAFANTLQPEEQQNLYDRYVVEEATRIYKQALLSMLPFVNFTRVNFRSPLATSPLLIVAGTEDNICPLTQQRNLYRKYSGDQGLVDLLPIPGAGHSLLVDHNWTEVATRIQEWLEERLSSDYDIPHMCRTMQK